MQSMFGMHNRDRFNVYVYTTSPWDGTAYRPRIANLVEHCIDISGWSLEAILRHIGEHEVHIREWRVSESARHRLNAARSRQPWGVHEGHAERDLRCTACSGADAAHGLCGDAGSRYFDQQHSRILWLTGGSAWCDYLICDPISCPQELAATEKWRSLVAGNPSTPAVPPLDLGGNIDPEENSEDWI